MVLTYLVTHMKKLTLLILALVSLSFFSIEKLDKKITKKLSQEFDGIEIEKKAIAKSEKGNYWYTLNNKSTKTKLGYMVVTQAKSRSDVFEYMIVFDLDKKIKAVDVLTYREEYGGEIGSKRFLKQFIGKSSETPIRINKEINGISGATISCNSITNSISEMTVKITSVN